MNYFATTSVIALILSASGLSAATLSTGSGDGSLTVGVSAFGGFGNSLGFSNNGFEDDFNNDEIPIDVNDTTFVTNALSLQNAFEGATDATYDPIGPVDASGTTFESYVYMRFGDQRIATDALVMTPAQIISQSDTQFITEFSIAQFEVRLTQTVSESFDGVDRVGSTLTQDFAIRNAGSVSTSFDMVRYIDGDLQFDGSIDDSGGITSAGSNRILFETDSTSQNDVSETFLGITTNVTGQNTNTTEGRFEIDSYSGLRNDIENGAQLDNKIEGDADGDGFIDGVYDVTMGLQDFVTVAAGATFNYTTSTLFGNAVPQAPGSTEALPLLPDNIGPDGGFQFDISAELFNIPQTIVWIDPVIAVGYTYEVTSGQTFSGVTAPSFGTVPDADQTYTLSYTSAVNGAVMATIMSGDTFLFDALDAVTTFNLTGIDTGLALDPANQQAFATGISLFLNGNLGNVNLSQTPITFDTVSVAAVPLPAAAWLMLLGLGGLVAAGGRRKIS